MPQIAMNPMKKSGHATARSNATSSHSNSRSNATSHSNSRAKADSRKPDSRKPDSRRPDIQTSKRPDTSQKPKRPDTSQKPKLRKADTDLSVDYQTDSEGGTVYDYCGHSNPNNDNKTPNIFVTMESGISVAFGPEMSRPMYNSKTLDDMEAGRGNTADKKNNKKNNGVLNKNSDGKKKKKKSPAKLSFLCKILLVILFLIVVVVLILWMLNLLPGGEGTKTSKPAAGETQKKISDGSESSAASLAASLADESGSDLNVLSGAALAAPPADEHNHIITGTASPLQQPNNNLNDITEITASRGLSSPETHLRPTQSSSAAADTSSRLGALSSGSTQSREFLASPITPTPTSPQTPTTKAQAQAKILYRILKRFRIDINSSDMKAVEKRIAEAKERDKHGHAKEDVPKKQLMKFLNRSHPGPVADLQQLCQSKIDDMAHRVGQVLRMKTTKMTAGETEFNTELCKYLEFLRKKSEKLRDFHARLAVVNGAYAEEEGKRMAARKKIVIQVLKHFESLSDKAANEKATKIEVGSENHLNNHTTRLLKSLPSPENYFSSVEHSIRKECRKSETGATAQVGVLLGMVRVGGSEGLTHEHSKFNSDLCSHVRGEEKLKRVLIRLDTWSRLRSDFANAYKQKRSEIVGQALKNFNVQPEIVQQQLQSRYKELKNFNAKEQDLVTWIEYDGDEDEEIKTKQNEEASDKTKEIKTKQNEEASDKTKEIKTKQNEEAADKTKEIKTKQNVKAEQEAAKKKEESEEEEEEEEDGRESPSHKLLEAIQTQHPDADFYMNVKSMCQKKNEDKYDDDAKYEKAAQMMKFLRLDEGQVSPLEVSTSNLPEWLAKSLRSPEWQDLGFKAESFVPLRYGLTEFSMDVCVDIILEDEMCSGPHCVITHSWEDEGYF